MTRLANVAVLGATGSIGRSTLDVIGRHPDRFRAFALTANTQSDDLFELCAIYLPRLAALADAHGAEMLKRRLAAEVYEILCGSLAMMQCGHHRRYA